MKKLLIAIIVLAAAGGYLYVFEQETVREWLKGTPLEPEPSRTVVYKWQDRDGNWQITDIPPAGDIPYERLEYRGNQNVMPLVPPEDRD